MNKERQIPMGISQDPDYEPVMDFAYTPEQEQELEKERLYRKELYHPKHGMKFTQVFSKEWNNWVIKYPKDFKVEYENE